MTRHSSSSSAKKYDVFEFNEEDERVEKTSQEILGKFANPSTHSPIVKYHFLKAFARGSETPLKNVATSDDPIDLDNEVSSDSDEEEAKRSPEKVSNKNKPLEVDDDDGNGTAADVDHEVRYANSWGMDTPLGECADKEITGFNDSVESDFDLKNQSTEVVSDSEDDDDLSQINSSTSITSKDGVPLEDQLVEQHDSIAFDIDNIKKVVVVFPDFIQYEDLYATRSRLIFSWSSLKLEGSTINGAGGTFKLEWACEDITKIESHWLGKVETAMINLLLKSKGSTEAGNINKNLGCKQLRFAVYDPSWSKAEEAIKLLDMRYTAIWSTIFDIDTDKNGGVSPLEQYHHLSQKHYFPIFDEAFEEVIYPKGEPDAISISKRDVELLRPETFINDTIIDFYIKYLKNKIPDHKQDRCHFFNCFFFRKLADLDKDPSSACDGKAAFQRVRKWTRRVNLFEKDYIIIPINYSLHWSLIVICHPGEVVCFKGEFKESSKVPCILHMDSLKGSHKGLKNVFQSYLCEEWKVRHNNVADDDVLKFLHLRFISLELPQQENFYDCGLFLLHYVERFLEEAPVNFNPFKIMTKFSNFLSSNWFPPPEASLKRSHIHNLIYNILDDYSPKAPSADCLDKDHSSEEPATNKHMEADSQGGSSLPEMCHGKNPSISTTEQETNILFPATSPLRVASSSREPGLVFTNIQGALVNSGSSNCLQMSTCYQMNFMSPIEEIEESGGGSALSLEILNSQATIMASDLPTMSYISGDLKAPETSLQGMSENFVEPVGGHSCSRASTSIPWNTLQTGAHEDQPIKKTEWWSYTVDNTDAVEYLSTSKMEVVDVVQDSQELNEVHVVDVGVKSHSSFQGSINSVSHQIVDLENSMNVGDDTLISKEEPLTSKTVKCDSKRSKHMNAEERRKRQRLTRSMSKKVCFMSCD
ncbi:PREDICTED: probable ubiquitin-like-specific protease 2A [Lupinus angustifolius]|uniref:probable ubiquitin-like-specific protease 2A n=1 Tax=Lupinus angustifolius TaxID=3871 RepID=UPI00092E8A08|nr:PREDICTED: probable ubiquitin-like-specific protease 2A [Lupinus angustifolius]